MRYFFLLLALWAFPLVAARGSVLVTIAPQKYLVEKIAGDTVSVTQIVPPQASPHYYEPSARQLIDLSNHTVWFRIGEEFENLLLPIFKTTKIIDQRVGVDLLPCKCCHHTLDAHDTHTWLSPRLLKTQAKQIAETLAKLYPKHAFFYAARLNMLLSELTALDQQIKDSLSNASNRTMLVSHPAFGYFCRDYGLEQLSIEQEGKEPCAKDIIALLSKGRDTHTVYMQPQYNIKATKKIADLLGADIVCIDPYAENVCDTLINLANRLGQQ